MKIDVNQIPTEGLFLEEDVAPLIWDLETDMVSFAGPITIKAAISRITNAVTANLELKGLMLANCSRCLNEFKINFQKSLKLNYAADTLEPIINLDPDIREEIILGYPIKPLCSVDCRGLCPKCGKDLNEGVCNCKQ